MVTNLLNTTRRALSGKASGGRAVARRKISPEAQIARARSHADNKYADMVEIEETTNAYTSYGGGMFQARNITRQLTDARQKWDAAEARYEGLQDALQQSRRGR